MMCKYEMDQYSIVEDTEWSEFCPQTGRRIDKVTLLMINQWLGAARQQVFIRTNADPALGQNDLK